MFPNPLQFTIERLHSQLSVLTGGEVATYIPELSLADPAHFGLSIATADGQLYSVGDHDVPFTIQSISKPFVYGLALDDLGVEAVMARVGVEPSGEAFNAISLEPSSGRPRNPMINAGAIASAGMIAGQSAAEKFERIRTMLSAYAGRPLDVSEDVFRSEKETGHRNRAIGHLLRNGGVLDGDVDEVCDRYFRQCAVLTTSDDLAMMAATLANGGVNPRTGDRAVASEHVERMLAVMSSCGMYDAAGAWIYSVGMPAKSGVGGGVLAVLPGQLGIGVFSPRLDVFGNSVRGIAACEAISREFGLHLLRPPLNLDSVVRASYQVPQVRSRRTRPAQEFATLEAEGGRTQVLQLQGALVLSTAEIVFRHTLERLQAGSILVFDLRRVTGFDGSVRALLTPFIGELGRAGGRAIFAVPCRDEWTAFIRSAAVEAGQEAAVVVLGGLDSALELCEEWLLAGTAIAGAVDEIAFAQHPLVAGCPEPCAKGLEAIAVREAYGAGEVLISRGGAPDAIFLVVHGTVEVSIESGGARHRLSTLGAGTTVGEIALIDGKPRSADVRALTDVVCYRVPVDGLNAAPGGLRARLVESLAVDLADRLRRANEELLVLAS